MKTAKLFLGVLAGLATGAALGVLFAPDKGSSTRKKISQKGHDYAGQLGEKLHDIKGNITKKFKSVREEAVNMAEDGMAKVEDGMEYVKNKY